MVLFVKFFGIIVVALGVVFLINPKTLKQYMSFWKKEKRLKIGGIAAILLGSIFLIAASQCRIAVVITVLGLWSVIKGIFLLTLNQKKLFAYLDWWLNKPTPNIRFFGLIALFFGALLIYSA
ncbi:MAG: hypothetical protein KAT96_00355 [Candidatus Omnitrophica bacterium]|nr:hypothetical protein [Candidatus Omnitrophota bacterium]